MSQCLIRCWFILGLSITAFGQCVWAGDPNVVEEPQFLTPQQSIDKFILADGYEINLYASEVDFPLRNPMAMAFDAQGRLWVSNAPTYPHLLPGEPPNDSVIILSDTDNDGSADASTTFLDGLYIPTGFAIRGDGAYIVDQPNLIYAEDIDGDGVADTREIVLHGFGSEDSHHSMSAFEWGPGGAFYFNEGTFHHSQVETPYGPKRVKYGAVFRFDPRSHRFEVFSSYPYANPWGHVFDAWGQNIVSDASNGANYTGAQVSSNYDYPRAGQEVYSGGTPVQSFTPGGRRPTSGTEIIHSSHFPEETQGRFLINQCIGFHGVRWYRIFDDGSGFGSESMPQELLRSTDVNFRPVDMMLGPDGALYVLDYHNPIVGHMQYSMRDERRDHAHGRIWRVTHRDGLMLEPPKIVGESNEDLLSLLQSYESRTRYHARLELQRRDPADVLPALDVWIASADPADPGYEHRLLEGLWVYQGLGQVNQPLLEKLLQAEDPRARAASTRVLRHTLPDIDEPLKLLRQQVHDDDQRVRLEAVLACGFVPSSDAANVALMSTKRPMDRAFEYVLDRTIAVLGKYGEPSGPIPVDFMLKRLGTKDLLEEELDEYVAYELLTRGADVSSAKREAALIYLAELNGNSRDEELLDTLAILDDKQLGRDELGKMLVQLGPSQLQTQQLRLESMAKRSDDPTLASIATAALILSAGSAHEIWQASGVGEGPSRDVVLASLGRISDEGIRASLAPAVTASLPDVRTADQCIAGRYVRVEIPGPATLTLPEVEVFSGTKNVAIGAKASQSTEAHGGTADLAVDGDTNGIFSSGTSSHTIENQEDPWWEVDLGKSVPIDSIRVWNRTEPPHGQRLNQFRIRILDESRSEVWEASNMPAPSLNANILIPGGQLQGESLSAIAALPRVTDPENAVGQLVPLTKEGNDQQIRFAAISAINEMPRSHWEAEHGHLDIKVVPIEAVRGKMIYDVRRFIVKAGQPVRIVLANNDLMEHNLLVIEPGALREVGSGGDAMSTLADGREREFVPDSEKILHVMGLTAPGDSRTLEFIAPEKPGKYPYVCTVPGHWRIMNGVMTVVR